MSRFLLIIYQKVSTSILATLCVFFALLISVDSFSQSGEIVEIEHADVLELINNDTAQIRKLIGHVRLRQDNMIFSCDSAYQFIENNYVDAYGHVHILQGDTFDLRGDTLHYYGNNEMAYMTGHVNLRDRAMHLTTDKLDFDLKNNMASYFNGGTLINEGSTLTSYSGSYYTTSKKAYFKKEVKLVNPDYTLESDTLAYHTKSKIAWFFGPTRITSKENIIYCESGWYDTKNEIAEFVKNARLNNPPQSIEADTLHYERNTGSGLARHHVVFTDTAKDMTIYCMMADYNEHTQSVLATGMPILINKVGPDSLYLAADTLLSIKDTTKQIRTLYAFHHVQLFKNNLQGVCDSLVWNDEDSCLYFLKDPILWSDSSQYTADTIKLGIKKGHIDKVWLLQHALIGSESAKGIYDQIGGRKITGLFRQDTLQQVLVDGNGESIYFAKDEHQAFIGVNRATCSHIIIYFVKNQIDQIVFMGQPEATLYPMQKIKLEEFMLDNFIWHGPIRPISFNNLPGAQQIRKY